VGHICSVTADGRESEAFRVVNRNNKLLHLVVHNRTRQPISLRACESQDGTVIEDIYGTGVTVEGGGEEMVSIRWTKDLLIVYISGQEDGEVQIDEVASKEAFASASMENAPPGSMHMWFEDEREES